MKKFFIILCMSLAAHPALLGMQSIFLQRKKNAIAITAGVATVGGLGYLAYKNPERVFTGIQGFQNGLAVNVSYLSQTVQNIPNSFSTAFKSVGSTYKNAGLFCALAQALQTKMGATASIFGMAAIGTQLGAWGTAYYNKKQADARKNALEKAEKDAFNAILAEQEVVLFKHDIENFNECIRAFDLTVWEVYKSLYFALFHRDEGGAFEKTLYIPSPASVELCKNTETIGLSGDWIKYISSDLITIGSSLIEGGKNFEKRKVGERVCLITQCQRNSIDLMSQKAYGLNDYLVAYVDNKNRKKCYLNLFSTIDTATQQSFLTMKEDIHEVFFQKNTQRLVIVFENKMQIYDSMTKIDSNNIGSREWYMKSEIQNARIPSVVSQDYIAQFHNNNDEKFYYQIAIQPDTLNFVTKSCVAYGYIAATKSGDLVYCPKGRSPLLLKKRAGELIVWGRMQDDNYIALLKDGNFVKITLPTDWEYAAKNLKPYQTTD